MMTDRSYRISKKTLGIFSLIIFSVYEAIVKYIQIQTAIQ